VVVEALLLQSRLRLLRAGSLGATRISTRYFKPVARKHKPSMYCWGALFYHPKTQAKIKGATMVASDSIMNFGVSKESLPQVIFSFGTAPEYDP
jgi:hypothetical protein